MLKICGNDFETLNLQITSGHHQNIYFPNNVQNHLEMLNVLCNRKTTLGCIRKHDSLKGKHTLET